MQFAHVVGMFFGVVVFGLAFGALPDDLRDGTTFSLFFGSGAFLGAYGGEVLPPFLAKYFAQ